jgi:hypothetical protein
MLNKISSLLDVVADSLEAKSLIKEAYEIDKVADEVDRLAFTMHTETNFKNDLKFIKSLDLAIDKISRIVETPVQKPIINILEIQSDLPNLIATYPNPFNSSSSNEKRLYYKDRPTKPSEASETVKKQRFSAEYINEKLGKDLVKFDGKKLFLDLRQ